MSENIFFFLESIWIDFFFKIIARLNRSNYKIIHQYKILHKIYISTTNAIFKERRRSIVLAPCRIYGKFNKWYYFWILAARVQVAAFIWFMDSLSCLVNNGVLMMMMHGHYTHTPSARNCCTFISRNLRDAILNCSYNEKKKKLLLPTLSSSHTRFSLFGNI